jgi:hypothetical protein
MGSASSVPAPTVSTQQAIFDEKRASMVRDKRLALEPDAAEMGDSLTPDALAKWSKDLDEVGTSFPTRLTSGRGALPLSTRSVSDRPRPIAQGAKRTDPRCQGLQSRVERPWPQGRVPWTSGESGQLGAMLDLCDQ